MIPLQNAGFQLDSSGVAGFFGGEEAISAMATVHMYKGRKWLGWYNSPGSYVIGKKYGRLAKSRFWNGLFPGAPVDPATLFEIDGQPGPEYRGLHSGTGIKDTGNVGYLFMKECESLVSTVVEGRKTSPVSVVIASLKKVPEERMYPTLSGNHSALIASIPMLASLTACATCGVYKDWYCFSMILLGVAAGGTSCYVIGSGKFTYTHPKHAMNSPNGDGIMTSEMQTVILIGREGAVNSVTRGKFSLNFTGGPEHRSIGLCSLLLTTQFLLQLLLIPQGSLFGQIMFLSTLAVSWVYNAFLSSLDREQIQREILLNEVLGRPKMRRYELGNRTSMVVFVLLASHPPDPSKLLDELLTNDTNTWKIWKRTVLAKLQKNEKLMFNASDYEGVDEGEKKLLATLYEDAESAYKGFSNNVDLVEGPDVQKRMDGRYNADEPHEGLLKNSVLDTV